MKRIAFVLLVLFSVLAGEGRPQAKEKEAERFIVLSEFQVWADAATPEVFKKLNRLYISKGRSHVFMLYPHYEYFVWEFRRVKHWIDEAHELGAFNLFCLGDDTRSAEGHLFTSDGLNPRLSDFFFKTVAYAHEKGFMVGVEPTGLPEKRDEAHFKKWLETWIGESIPGKSRPDVIKLSIEWFGAYKKNPRMAGEVAAFFTACREVNPRVLVYVDSINGIWRRPQVFHKWLLGRFPGTILSHYLNTSQVEAFRAMGARNMMVQVNPCEVWGRGGQFFIYYDKTVDSLKDVVKKRVRFLSLAGVNYGYNRYEYDLFLEVVRPHLDLAGNLEELKKAVVKDAIRNPPTEEAVRRWILGLK